MSMHSFSPDVAERVGLNSAVLYQNILFWTKKNAANGKHIRDGYVWTYNSRAAFASLFPYLSESQVKTGIQKLIDSGLIIKGDYNLASYDRTNWYAVSDSANWPETAIGQKSPMDWSEIANGLVRNRQPIPDSKPVIKPDTNAREEISQEQLDAIWEAYPDDGKVSAAKANLPFRMAGPVKWLGGIDAVLVSVRAYAAAVRKADQKPKSIVNFLADRALLERYASSGDRKPVSETDRIRALVFEYKRYGDWRGEGPPPGAAGCKAPAHILAEFGYAPQGGEARLRAAGGQG